MREQDAGNNHPLYYHKLKQEQNKKKLSGNLSPALCAFIAKQEKPFKDEVANAFVNILLRHLANKKSENSVDLNRLISAEERSTNEHAETALRDILALQNITQLPDIMYGQSVPIELRMMWQSKGMDPNSDDDVRAFFEANNINYMNPEKVNSQALENLAQDYKPTPTPSLKPKPE